MDVYHCPKPGEHTDWALKPNVTILYFQGLAILFFQAPTNLYSQGPTILYFQVPTQLTGTAHGSYSVVRAGKAKVKMELVDDLLSLGKAGR